MHVSSFVAPEDGWKWDLFSDIVVSFVVTIMASLLPSTLRNGEDTVGDYLLIGIWCLVLRFGGYGKWQSTFLLVGFIANQVNVIAHNVSKVDISSGQAVKQKALIGWNHPPGWVKLNTDGSIFHDGINISSTDILRNYADQ
ncbi:hypothetical protein GH714_013838 [Hevea brasiliensis]|uniref:Uncharacterized protein n=1 Tax=Hevea brasiliensis TaxID=3981 RepID=A0A6A6L3B4_HEVBR|nr:hypothetical protein GH714_013838 [Hevea brasiliensis]